MTRFNTILVLFFLSTITYAQQEIVGKWKTIDDTSGEARSIVEIYVKQGKIFGKVSSVLKESERNKLCKECTGEDYNKPIEGLEIIRSLEKDGDEYENGTILDPENGKTYRCKLWIDEDAPNTLNVRGYIAFLFRTQQWKRVDL